MDCSVSYSTTHKNAVELKLYKLSTIDYYTALNVKSDFVLKKHTSALATNTWVENNWNMALHFMQQKINYFTQNE